MVIKKKVLWNKTANENHKYYFYNYTYLGGTLDNSKPFKSALTFE